VASIVKTAPAPAGAAVAEGDHPDMPTIAGRAISASHRARRGTDR
jgi:hypothetical protein